MSTKAEDRPEPVEQEPAPVSVVPPSPRVRFVEAMPNKMFTPQLTALIRFVLAGAPIACAECGKLTRKLWTMLAPFHATNMLSFTLKRGIEREPLVLVCADHPLAPAERIIEVLADDKAPWPWEAEASEDDEDGGDDEDRDPEDDDE